MKIKKNKHQSSAGAIPPVLLQAGSHKYQVQERRLKLTARQLLLVATCLSLGVSGLRAGSEPVRKDNADTDVYEVVFFDRFRPQNALDVVLKVPGFSFDKGDSVRGFSGAAGNVLINGARPSVKTGGIEDVLKRIPAAQVVRVEVIHGTAGAGEAAGQSVVLNVVREANGQTGTWTVGLRYPEGGRLSPSFEGVLAKSFGEWDGSFKLNGFYKHFPREAEIKAFDAVGDVLFRQTENRPAALTDIFLSGDIGRKFGDKSLQLTTRWGWSRFHSFTDRIKFQPKQLGLIETFDSDRNSRYFEGEVGLDWTQPLGSNYKWRVIALASGQHWTVVAPTRIEDHVSESDRGSDYQFERDKFEGIFRTLFSDVSTSKFKPEFGIEIAYNRADFDVDLVSITGGARAPVLLPASDVLVEELRGEAFANAIWQFTSTLSIEAGMALEVSNIATSGNVETSQTLSYLKPSTAIVYSFSDKLQTRLSFSRTVGQLDFSDFAASADFEADREFGGNLALRPHRSSKVSATTKWSFGTGGALQLDVYHERRNGVLEQIVLPSGAHGVGAAGNAKINGLDVSLTAPIDRLIHGGQIEVIAKTVSSTFDDPVTGLQRNLTNEAKPELEFKFRQDKRRYPVSWGGSLKINTDERNYYIDEISKFTDRDRFEGFVETTIASGLKLRFDYVREGSYLDRQFFSPTRAGAFAGREVHDRRATNVFSLTLSGQF